MSLPDPRDSPLCSVLQRQTHTHEVHQRKLEAQERAHQVMRDSWNSERQAILVEKETWQKERAEHIQGRESIIAAERSIGEKSVRIMKIKLGT